MKELSIEQKAKRYDEALEVLHKYDGANIMFSQSLKEEMFPELKEESENERIRKNCIHFLELQKQHHAATFEIEECIAWIENQCNKEPITCPICGWEIKKQDEHLQGKSALEAIKEDKANNQNCVMPVAEKIEPKFKPGDTMRTKKEAADNINEGMPVIISIDKEYYHCNNELIAIKDQDDYEYPPMNRIQKIAEVKQKFNIGNWIVFNGDVYYIGNIALKGYYECLKVDGTIHTFSFSIDNKSHLWTIRDAKDGDVLVCKSDKMPFIFKGLLDKFHPDCPVAYCGLCEGDKFEISTGNGWWTDEEVLPATKEQIEHLMKVITDAGYEWNAEKKELKRVKDEPENHKRWIGSDTTNSVKDHIGQNPTDEEMKRLLQTEYEKGRADAISEMQKSWSEEDEMFVHGLIRGLAAKRDIHGHTTFSSDCIDITETINWLKSLRPQSQWKPSEEQMKILNEVLNFAANHESSHWNDYIFGTLNNLIRQLKKLRK